MNDEMIPFRDELAEAMRPGEVTETTLADADALLAPDGPLWPALRALGYQDAVMCSFQVDKRGQWLYRMGVTGPLADACLAAVEEES